MSAYSADKKTLSYQLGESLSTMTDHYLLMTATPHKGDPKNFCLFLELLDRDVYAIANRLLENFDALPEDEQQAILDALEGVVASVDPSALREEILQLNKLSDQARRLEQREVESKLTKLKEVITTEGVFDDPRMKLLIFTEHKDTLDYLVGKLREWNLSVTQIHGGMKIGDRDMPGSRLYAEREFRDECQVMVATEAAGEGINLQFCWFMINYDIPWNPARLKQRICFSKNRMNHLP